jgi:hypothetical protein
MSRRLELTIDVQDWIAKREALPFLTFVPVDNAIFLRSVFLSANCTTIPPIESSSSLPSWGVFPL